MKASAWPSSTQPWLGVGRVGHRRLAPSEHAFAYGAYFLMLPMRHLHDPSWALPVNRRAWLSFAEADHGRGEAGGALAWFEDVLRQAGIEGVDGEVWLQCFPRLWGYSFKPVSFWYGLDAQQQLRVVVAEVNNTFGQRHCYVIDQARWGETREATKAFHVSPFCALEGRYRFRFAWSGQRVVARVEHDAADGATLIQTSWGGELSPYTEAAAKRAAWRHPLMTFMVTWRIHWHALLLWLKRVPFHRLPPEPKATATVATPPRSR